MTLDKILNFLYELVPKELIIEKSDYIILPTICHNHDYQNASHKLYLYKNLDSVPLFHCYTECSETFNIYQLIMKYYELRNQKITFKEAFKKFHGYEYKTEEHIYIPEVKHDNHFANPLSVQLPEYSKHILDVFYLDDSHPWCLEGIDLGVLDKHGIGYSKSMEQISIPHYDWRGRLIGIRVRNMNEFRLENYKYIPLHANNIFYSHPLSLNLYGIFFNQTNIKKNGTVYLYEAEKSVLLHESMIGENIALATCGKNLSKWQINLLIYFLNSRYVIIGFDKEYKDYSSAFDYVKKIEEQTIYLRNYAKVGVMIDDKNLLREKQAPVDGTISTFQNLKIWWLD